MLAKEACLAVHDDIHSGDVAGRLTWPRGRVPQILTQPGDVLGVGLHQFHAASHDTSPAPLAQEPVFAAAVAAVAAVAAAVAAAANRRNQIA